MIAVLLTGMACDGATVLNGVTAGGGFHDRPGPGDLGGLWNAKSSDRIRSGYQVLLLHKIAAELADRTRREAILA
jgi:hypothetical protein